jgi:hypothetical protein
MIPPHEITMASFYIGQAFGIDTFTGRDIVSMDLKKLPPEMQFNAYTSEFGKLIGKATGMSPAKVDHLMGSLFGTVGRDITNASNAILPAIGIGDQRAPSSFEDKFIVSRFSRRAARGSLSGQEFWEQMTSDGGEFVAAAEGYKKRLNAGDLRGARDMLNGLTDEQKAYALLEGQFSEKEQDLHPLNRARQVLNVASTIRKEMVLDRLITQATAKKAKKGEGEKIELSPSVQKIVNETLEDISMREARNALIVLGHEGWAQKKILPVDGLLKELRAAAPAVADEYEARMHKGRNKVYSFEGVRKVWPEAKARLLKDQEEASLADLRAEAAGH